MSKTTGGTNTAEKNYNYAYDIANRLTGASYQEYSSGSWNTSGAYNENSITYDLNGNISTLKRNSVLSGTIAAIDDLNYTYDGNHLTNVTDAQVPIIRRTGIKI